MLQFQFHERIAQLIYTFPEDATTSTGSLFWSAPKRFPQPLTFDPADPSHVAFAQAGAILKAQVHNIEMPSWAADFSKVIIMCHFSRLLILFYAQALVHQGRAQCQNWQKACQSTEQSTLRIAHTISGSIAFWRC